MILFLTAMLVGSSSALAFEQSSSPKESTAIVEGTIRDIAGNPVASATVLLEETNNTAIVETRTKVDGTFVLSSGHAGSYTLRARKAGFGDSVAGSLVMSPGDKKHVDLILQPAPATRLKPSQPSSAAKEPPVAMEFKDEPNFTVAGVTDWSNLGLHGSAASTKTSESLARDTLTLQSGEPGAVPAAGFGKQYLTALAYRDKGDFADAREEVRRVLASTDDAEGHRLLGELDERLNDPLGAVREYEHATRMEPGEQNYFEWGMELLLHKAAEPAMEVFMRGSSAHPKSARMLTGLGVALYSIGSWDQAARRLCEASDLEPENPAPYLFLGKIEKTASTPLPCSEQKLARFAQKQPANALANYYYAVSIWKRAKASGNPADSKQVETLLEKAVGIDPKLDEAYLQLGILHFAAGTFERAIEDYKKALQVNPSLGEAHRQLGLAYQRADEKSKAQQEFAAYEQIEKTEAIERDRQQRELRQFLIILKDQPAVTPPQ